MNYKKLTALDMQVTVMLLQGLNDCQIARALHITKRLVEKKRKHTLDVITGKE